MPHRQPISAALAALLSLGLVPAAQAAPGETAQVPGRAEAEVVEPLRIQPLEDLRFGTFMQPAVAGTVIVAPSGAVSGTVDRSGFPPDRGAARFDVDGEGARLFVLFLPGNITISNGTATMEVDRFTANITGNVLGRFGRDGHYDLRIGGRLNVQAVQQPGEYSGTFEFTVIYL